MLGRKEPRAVMQVEIDLHAHNTVSARTSHGVSVAHLEVLTEELDDIRLVPDNSRVALVILVAVIRRVRVLQFNNVLAARVPINLVRLKVQVRFELRPQVEHSRVPVRALLVRAHANEVPDVSRGPGSYFLVIRHEEV